PTFETPTLRRGLLEDLLASRRHPVQGAASPPSDRLTPPRLEQPEFDESLLVLGQLLPVLASGHRQAHGLVDSSGALLLPQMGQESTGKPQRRVLAVDLAEPDRFGQFG